MATFTERLALIIDAKTGGAVRDINKAADASLELGTKTDLASRTVQRLGVESVLSGAQLKAGVAAGAAAAGFAFASFAKNSIEAASALEEQGNRVDVVFGKSSGTVQDFAKNSATSLGLSERAALQAAAGFGTIFTEIGNGPQAAAQLSTGFTRLASDLASFNNLQGGTEEGVQRLTSGLAGETEALRPLGVFLNEAAVKAKAAELGFGGAHRELTEGEKVMARYALIIDQTRKAQGDFDRTSGSLANQQRILQAQIEDLSATVGQVLVPAFTELASSANAVLSPLLSVADAVGGMEKIGGVIGKGLLAAAGPIGSIGGLVADLTGREKDSADAADESADAYAGLGSILTSYKAKSDEAKDAARERAKAEREAADAVEDSFFGARDAQKTYTDSLESVSDAEREVEDARRDLAEASRESAAEQARAAEEIVQAQDAVADANERVADSHDAVRQAEERRRRAEFQLQEQQEETSEAQRNYDQALADFGPNHHITVAALEELQDQQQELSERQFDAEEAARGVIEANEDLADAERDLRDAQDELTAAQERGVESSTRLRDAVENLSDAEENLRDAQDEAARAAFDLNEKQKALEESLRKSGDAGGFLGDKIRGLIELFPAAAPWLEALAGEADGMTSSFQRANEEMQRTLDLIGLLPGLGFTGTPSQGAQDVAGIMFGTSGGGEVGQPVGTIINVFPQAGQSEEEIARQIAWIGF